jgi:hypothetical protein
MRNIFLLLSAILLATCTKLEVAPRSTESAEVFFAEEGSYRAYLARIYAGLAVTGQQGPSGDPDLQNNDEGFSSYLRQYWQLQELTTDEAVIGWTDEGLSDLHAHTWTSNNQFVRTMYARLYFQVALANDFLRQTAPDKLDARAVSPETRALIPGFRAEARYLRALSYYHGLDLFGRLPLYVEATPLGGELTQSTRATVFNFVEAELQDLQDYLPAPGSQDYGRVDRAAVWVLQTQLYLNAEVYTGSLRYQDCLAAANRIFASNAYVLSADYHHLFRTDNDTSPEIIYAIPFDGRKVQTWGGMTYLVHAPLGGRMNPADYGVSGAWAGLRTTSAMVLPFFNQGFTDRRAVFYTNGQSLEIDRIADFQQGYAVPKFTNLSSAGVAGVDETFPDTDFPLFRLGAVYLDHAEAALRAGDLAARPLALANLNTLRARAGGQPLTDADLTLEYLLAERTRELHWEGARRTDLVRYGQFTTGAVWPWKGGTKEGLETADYRNVFPVPEAELLANPALRQNAGY